MIVYPHGLATLCSLQFSDADAVLHVVPLFRGNAWGTPLTSLRRRLVNRGLKN